MRIKAGLAEKVVFELPSVGGEREEADVWRDSIPGRGNSKCGSLEVDVCTCGMVQGQHG